MEQKQSQYVTGVLAAGLSYLIWGFLPLYWKAVGTVPAGEVLAHRIIWSLVFMLLLLLLLGKWKVVAAEIKAICRHKSRPPASSSPPCSLASIGSSIFLR